MNIKTKIDMLLDYFDDITIKNNNICVNGSLEQWGSLENSFNKTPKPDISIVSIMEYMLSMRRHSYTKYSYSAHNTIEYAREYQTITFNPGRQFGKTDAINTLSCNTDVIVCNNEQQRKYYGTIAPVITFYNIKIRGASLNPRVIWVDNASYYDPESVDKIYHTFLRNPTQIFFFVG